MYLARNSVITAIQDLYAECVYASRQSGADPEVKDLGEELMRCVEGYEKALDGVEVEVARAEMSKVGGS